MSAYASIRQHLLLHIVIRICNIQYIVCVCVIVCVRDCVCDCVCYCVCCSLAAPAAACFVKSVHSNPSIYLSIVHSSSITCRWRTGILWCCRPLIYNEIFMSTINTIDRYYIYYMYIYIYIYICRVRRECKGVINAQTCECCFYSMHTYNGIRTHYTCMYHHIYMSILFFVLDIYTYIYIYTHTCTYIHTYLHIYISLHFNLQQDKLNT
jgi:hypothetical protein